MGETHYLECGLHSVISPCNFRRVLPQGRECLRLSRRFYVYKLGFMCISLRCPRRLFFYLLPLLLLLHFFLRSFGCRRCCSCFLRGFFCRCHCLGCLHFRCCFNFLSTV